MNSSLEFLKSKENSAERSIVAALIKHDYDQMHNSAQLRLAGRSAKVYSIKLETLELVYAQNYEGAIQLLKNYLNKNFPFYNFRIKVEKLVQHAVDLVLVIQSNKTFLEASSLTRPKQQEIRDKVKKHLDELKIMLDRIEATYVELNQKDLKTMRYVVKAIWFSIVMVSITGFVIEMVRGGVYSQAEIIVGSWVDAASGFVSRWF